MESFKTGLEKQSSVVETKPETISEEKEGKNGEESAKTQTTKTDISSTDNSTTDISKTSKSEAKKDSTAEAKSTSDA